MNGNCSIRPGQCQHPQDHPGQRRAQDFRVCERGPGLELIRTEQRKHTPAAMRPQRPARWLDEVRLIASICKRSSFCLGL